MESEEGFELLRKTVSWITLTLLLVSVGTWAFNIQTVKAEPRTIFVPDDYPTIQGAINAANSGDTIYVKAGTYYENIRVEKAVSLIGENRENTIIDGGEKGTVVFVQDDVIVSGFTIRNCGVGYSGIYVFGRNNTIQYNDIINNVGYAIHIGWWSYKKWLSNTTVYGNNIKNNSGGISLLYSCNNTIGKNHIEDSRIGIWLYRVSSDNIVYGNDIRDNRDWGIYLDESSKNTISENNVIKNNRDGIYLSKSSDNKIFGNIITMNNLSGIFLSSSSENNMISENSITANNRSGIVLFYSNSSIIDSNEIYDNNRNGIWLGYSSNNTFIENRIANNVLSGIYSSESSKNKIFHNDFNNSRQVYDISWDYPDISPSINVWDDGYPSGGNYWSDYIGVDADADGIGDTPYFIDANNRDRYPLMKPYGVPLVPKFLTLPFRDADIEIQQGWVYTFPGAHKGIDYIKGTIDKRETWQSFHVVAAADGWAMWSEQPGTTGVYGKFVFIRHDKKDELGNDYFTLYAHLESIATGIPYQDRYNIDYNYNDASKWKFVRRGEVIGKAGNTGASNTGIHLHFEVQRGGYSLGKTDPYDLYGTRDFYPGGSNYIGCGQNHLWTADPPSLPPALSDDIYWLAKAIMSEASVGTREEQVSVGWTVLNRLRSCRFGDSIAYIVKRWYAYNQEPTEGIKALAKDLLEGKIPDLTDGATHFFSPRGMPKEGEDTSGFDVGGGLHQVPLDGQDVKVYFPSWAKPEKGVAITEDTTRYLTAQPIPNKLEWRNLAAVRTWYFMFYRPYTMRISAGIGSPGELRVYDPQGRVSGLVNGTVVMDIPGSVYFENTLVIFFPNETYRYMVRGATEGLYGLTVTVVTRQENITFTAIDIPTSITAIHQYTIDWTALSQGQKGVTVQVDSEGDGVFEHAFTSDSELTQNEYATALNLDVAIVSVLPSTTEVYVGQVVNITVIVQNEAKVAETFIVICKYELEGIEHTIGTQTVTNLAPNTTTILTFTWTTTDITVHPIKAEIPPLPGETDTTDNTLTSPTTVKVKILGDVNGDDKIDIKDLYIVIVAFGSYPGHPRWNPQADLDFNGKIDIRDIYIILKNFGKTHL